MKLLTVRVQDFKCIEDSTEFSVADVTCLVGKNESGKTAVLKALHKLKCEKDKKESFTASSDYPRRKWRPNLPIPDDPPAITTSWEFNDEEVISLEKKFGSGLIRGRKFTLGKGYNNVKRYSLDLDESKIVKKLLTDSKLSPEEHEPLRASADLESLVDTLSAIETRSGGQEELLQSSRKAFPKGATLAVIDAVDEMVPSFLYFDEYLTLPGTVAVDEIAARQSQTLTDKDRIFLALLSLAGTSLDQVKNAGTFEEFNASLRAVSNQITDQIFQYWTQNRHLHVEIRLDHSRPNDPPPYNSGWIFRTRIENRRHRADTSFDDRSHGFVWFFSFLIWFYHLRAQNDKSLIILLDEPGLSLHAKAQADLLRYIKEQLNPKYQVIYTTHSPFMIDPDDLLTARTVEDVVEREKLTGEEKLLGTKVSEDVLSTDPDTLSPLQRALGYELTQTLFVGRYTLLVEGPSDFLYLKWFSRQLEKSGKPCLDYRWNICVVGGIDRIPGFVSLFRGNGLRIAAIVDVQQNHKNKIENARKSLQDRHLLTVDTYATQNEADIEDVLGRDFYVALVNKSLDLRPGVEVPATKPTKSPIRVVKEVELHAATPPPNCPEFNHFVPADWLFQHGDEGASLPGFSNALDRMGRVINDLNSIIT